MNIVSPLFMPGNCTLAPALALAFVGKATTHNALIYEQNTKLFFAYSEISGGLMVDGSCLLCF